MRIDIVEIGKDYVLFSDGVKLYSHGKLRDEAVMSYIHCHYEVWVEPDRFEKNLAKDNLRTLDIPEDTRQELIKRFIITKDDTVLEIGAYMGWGTAKLSQMAKKVVAVEADWENYKMAHKNIKENNIKNVDILNFAVGKERGKMRLYYGTHGQARSLYPRSLNKVTSFKDVDVMPIDSIYASKVDYITLTINLGELDALMGMERLLKANNARIISAGWYKLDGKPASYKIKEYLESLGYDVFIGKVHRVYALKL